MSEHGEAISAAQQGDAAALARVLEVHAPMVYRFAMAMCGNRVDAEEISQETLLAAAQHVREFRGTAAFSSWLFTIAKRNCQRHRRRPEATALPEGLPDATASPAAIAAEHQMTRALQAAIADLPPELREVLWLRDVEGLPAADVAAALTLSVANVKTRLHRARLQLRMALNPTVATDARPATCPDVLTKLSEELEGDVPPAVCEILAAHVAGCARCRSLCDSLHATLASCARENVAIPKDVAQRLRARLPRSQ